MANSSGWLNRSDRLPSGLGYSRCPKGSAAGTGISRAAPTRGTLLGSRRLRCARGRTDPDRLDVDELADPEDRELAAEAGLLHAAERQAWIGGDHAVDEHAAGLDPPRQLLAERRIARPH